VGGSTPLIIAFRLLLAVVFGGLIGLERESHGRPAGFRTHILVSLGSTLIMLVSAYGLQSLDTDYDPGRIAAQVISGIGFLGAGTILREGANVRGLTTAASLWAVAGIGLAVGIGMYYAAAIATILVVLTLLYLNRFELGHHQYSMRITTSDQINQMAAIFTAFVHHGIEISQMTINNQTEGIATIELAINAPRKARLRDLVVKLNELEGIQEAVIIQE
jgi:putative Mg2+ transporter-C (MgtC) family protein